MRTHAVTLALAALPATAGAQVLPDLPPPSAPPPAAAAAPPFYSGGVPRPPPRPAFVPYEEGDPIPPGARVVTRMRVGLITAGASIFGTFYFASALVGSLIGNSRDREGSWLFVPVVGPFAYAASLDDPSHSETAWMIVYGVIQGGGLAMLLGGALNPVRSLTYDRAAGSAPRWTLTPGFAGGPGASLHVTF